MYSKVGHLLLRGGWVDLGQGRGVAEQGSSGVGHGSLFEPGAGDRQVDLGGRQVAVAEEALELRQGGPIVDEQRGIGVAKGVGQRARWGSDPCPSEPRGDQVVEGPSGEGPTVGAHEQLVSGRIGPEAVPPAQEVGVDRLSVSLRAYDDMVADPMHLVTTALIVHLEVDPNAVPRYHLRHGRLRPLTTRVVVSANPAPLLPGSRALLAQAHGAAVSRYKQRTRRFLPRRTT